MKTISADQHYRNLRTFFAWAVEAGLLPNDPTRSIPKPRIPMPLPDVPVEAELRAVLAACSETFEGTRNRAVILVLADAGLRAGELTRLRVRDWEELSLTVRAGKGGRDRVVFVSPTTAEAMRRHLAMRPGVGDADPLFTDMDGQSLTPRNLVQVLHRLSAKAGLPPARRLHPHALRHFAATSWLRHGMGLDHARRLLGHTSLHMTLRYSSLVAADLQQAHKEAAAVERMLSNAAPRPRARRPRATRAPTLRIVTGR